MGVEQKTTWEPPPYCGFISIHSQHVNILPTYDWVHTLIGILGLEKYFRVCTSGMETSSLA